MGHQKERVVYHRFEVQVKDCQLADQESVNLTQAHTRPGTGSQQLLQTLLLYQFDD